MQEILKVINLTKNYLKNDHDFKALDDINFTLKKGDSLAIVGESGCGKSTLANILIRLETPTTGEVLFKDKNIHQYSRQELKQFYRQVQMVFQLPQESFNPRQRLGDSIIEPLINIGTNKAQAKQILDDLLTKVALPLEIKYKYPHQISGGQCQRCAIARTISIKPQVLICDEITSALDTITQMEILNLLLKLRQELDLSIIFISHDLALVQKLCNKILIMYQGKIIERGLTSEILKNPQEEYTKELINICS